MAIISSGRVLKQLQPFTLMVHHFLDVNCIEGANIVADTIHSHLTCAAELLAKLTHEDIEAYIKMVMDLEGESSTASAQRISSMPSLLKYLKGEQLGNLIIGFCSLKNSSRPFDRSVLQDISQEFLAQENLCNIADHTTVIEVFESFILLGNGSFIGTMVEKFCSTLQLTDKGCWSQNFKFSLLMDIIGSSNIWRTLIDNQKDLVLTASYEVMKYWVAEITVHETALSSSGNVQSPAHQSRYNYRINYYGNTQAKTDLKTEIHSCLKLFTVVEKERLSTDEQKNQTMLALFSQLFSKMSFERLHSLMKKIYSAEAKVPTQSNFKQYPLLVELCKAIGRAFINLPQLSAELKSSTVEFIVDVFKYLFWIEDCQVLFAQKNIAVHPLDQDKPLVSQITNSSELRKMATSGSPENSKAFLLFLDSRISTLNARISVSSTSLAWEQTYAVYPSCPIVESFLKSSRETCTYANHFSGIADARRFSQQLRDGQKTGNYRISVQENGSGRSAMCLISKTTEGIELTGRIRGVYKKESDDLTKLRLSIQQQKARNEPNAGTLQLSADEDAKEDSFLPAVKKARIDVIDLE